MVRKDAGSKLGYQADNVGDAYGSHFNSQVRSSLVGVPVNFHDAAGNEGVKEFGGRERF